MSVIQRVVRRYAAKHRPSDPQCLEDLTINGPWAENIDGNTFLIEDNMSNSDRIIIFGSKVCLSHLATSHTWMMDGTFKVVPNLFKQLYVIRSPLEGSSISCVYALMTRKNEASYQYLLRTIVKKCADMGSNLNLQTRIFNLQSSDPNLQTRMFLQPQI